MSYLVTFLFAGKAVQSQIATTGEVTVYWRGDDTVKIRTGEQELTYLPYQEKVLQLPANKQLKVSITARSHTYSADKYLTVQTGKGYLSIELLDPDIIFQYNPGSRLKNCTDAIALNMVAVKGGSFNMGNATGDENEKPVHTVKLHDFFMSKYEVTQEQWRAVMGDNPGYFKGCPDCPVENIDWEDAMRFIARLNELTGKHYRLPTEAEWEYAARGGTETAGNQYSGSNTLNDVAWYYQNSNKKTHPVGTKMPNELGIYDMSGNVWEWCSDWYGETYYAGSPLDNPRGPLTGDMHVLRGGSWFDFDIECLTIHRFHPLSDYRKYVIGFRLAE